MNDINLKIKEDFIRLDQALKLANLVQTGGHGKLLITQGQVFVNGQVETRRGKKLRPGDQVVLEDNRLIIE